MIYDEGSAMSELQHHAPYPPIHHVAPKNPGVALLASIFFPGLGSLMNGHAGKGIGIFVGYVLSWFLVILFVGIFGVIGFWIWGMVDAYQGAKSWNARHGIVS
ncbi:TM2 domain-containing membrane protein YozV [Phycicoccus badiiscoriae]|uniref:TM2 domain-containing membrane protein YozV n=1 Tax=Pedococcus badiiscoriae TaxID=642776 RepID=A0A852WHN3_9MICO|nr:hypothetical protein [Pedococcus badiiscoriae]NYG05775.1 TM2 domain-containing membrane protein YozV [Pedococcus badiiscoriae]